MPGENRERKSLASHMDSRQTLVQRSSAQMERWLSYDFSHQEDDDSKPATRVSDTRALDMR